MLVLFMGKQGAKMERPNVTHDTRIRRQENGKVEVSRMLVVQQVLGRSCAVAGTIDEAQKSA